MAILEICSLLKYIKKKEGALIPQKYDCLLQYHLNFRERPLEVNMAFRLCK